MTNAYDHAIKPANIPAAIIDFNQRVLGIDPRELGPMSEPEFKATIKAFLEEVEELEEAHQHHDFIGQIDAVVDLIYFAYGALYKMGLTAKQILDISQAVHDANMEKKLGVVAKRGNPLGDAVKPEGWIGPEERIADILDN